MSFRLFGCGKYRRLLSEKEDRALQLVEREFMAKHRVVCDDCRRQEQLSASALNMLRLASFEEAPFEAESGAIFEERVMRRWRVTAARESVRYWSPAFVGAAIAGLTVLAALQLVSNRQGMPSTSAPGGEAKLQRPNSHLPSIDIDRITQVR